MAVLRLIFLLPFLLLLVVFALSNTANTTFGLWPTDLAVVAPLSVAVLAAAAVFFLLGALVTWFGTLGQVRRARRAEARVLALEGENAELRTRLPVVLPPGGAGVPVGAPGWDALPPAA